MNLNEFTENAIKTESLIDKVKVREDILESALYAFFYSSEILDALKKNVFYNKPINIDNMAACGSILKKVGEYLENPELWEVNNLKELKINPRIFHAIIGIMTESGELGSLLMKTLSGNELDTINMLEEFGDISWYKAIAYDETKTNPEMVLEAVINKLRDRYPNKFTSDAAINRDLDKERNTLESNLRN